jgi:hypothetical protein
MEENKFINRRKFLEKGGAIAAGIAIVGVAFTSIKLTAKSGKFF